VDNRVDGGIFQMPGLRHTDLGNFFNEPLAEQEHNDELLILVLRRIVHPLQRKRSARPGISEAVPWARRAGTAEDPGGEKKIGG